MQATGKANTTRDALLGAEQYTMFVQAADRQDDVFLHDMLHAAARIVEVMPRYANGSETEYIARWLDAAWEKYV